MKLGTADLILRAMLLEGKLGWHRCSSYEVLEKGKRPFCCGRVQVTLAFQSANTFTSLSPDGPWTRCGYTCEGCDATGLHRFL